MSSRAEERGYSFWDSGDVLRPFTRFADEDEETDWSIDLDYHKQKKPNATETAQSASANVRVMTAPKARSFNNWGPRGTSAHQRGYFRPRPMQAEPHCATDTNGSYRAVRPLYILQLIPRRARH
jgi:hypothetical protein